MKKLMLSLMAAFMLLSIFPVQVQAGNKTRPATTVPATSPEAIEANILLSRLDEIHAMDLSGLNKAEKKELRQEVRAIKSELKAIQGVYLSVGAILIIILILVLLL
jgi:hypothetical protein